MMVFTHALAGAVLAAVVALVAPEHAPVAFAAGLAGGVAPVRAYAEELMADVLQGTLDPSPVFTKTVDLDGVPEGYRAMDDREAVKVLVKP